MPASFFDSNILIYTISSDAAKRTRARALADKGGSISVQVLNEMASVARRKMQLDWAATKALTQHFRTVLTVVDLTEALHADGLDLGARYGFSVYDAMIVAAARAAGCDTLWSEDMHHGLVVEDHLTIRDPFRA